jgi:hypothetical protein
VISTALRRGSIVPVVGVNASSAAAVSRAASASGVPISGGAARAFDSTVRGPAGRIVAAAKAATKEGAGGFSVACDSVAVVWSQLDSSPAAVRESVEPFVAFAIT